MRPFTPVALTHGSFGSVAAPQDPESIVSFIPVVLDGHQSSRSGLAQGSNIADVDSQLVTQAASCSGNNSPNQSWDASEGNSTAASLHFRPVQLQKTASKKQRVAPVTLGSLGCVPDEILRNELEGSAASWSEHASVRADAAVGHPPLGIVDPAGWWIERVLTLPPEECTGWVVAQIVDMHSKEDINARITQRRTFDQRMSDAGMVHILGTTRTPRSSCSAVAGATRCSINLLDEAGQRSMLHAISHPLSSYVSGLRCWAAFMGAVGCTVHFPATEANAIRYISMFCQS